MNSKERQIIRDLIQAGEPKLKLPDGYAVKVQSAMCQVLTELLAAEEPITKSEQCYANAREAVALVRKWNTPKRKRGTLK